MGLRIAVVGLGSFGTRHAKTIKRLGLGEITAVVSRHSVKRLIPEARAYKTTAELLENEKIDTMVIAIPPFAHGDTEMLAARHGVPFFVEKPVSNDIITAHDILDEVRASGIITSVGYHSRYSSAIEKAKELLENEEPLSIHGYWLDSLPDAAWWKKRAESGGQLVEQATHIIDIFRYLLGEPLEIYSKGRKGLPSVDFESSTETIITFPGNRIAVLSTSCEKEKGSKIGFTVSLRKGAMDYGWNGKLSVRNSDGTFTAGPDTPNQLYEDELRAFLKAVETGDRSLIKSDYEDAVRTLKVSLLARESMRTGRPMKVPKA